MLSAKLGHALDPYLSRISRLLFNRHKVDANVVTIAGTIFGFISCALIISNHPFYAGLSLLVSACCDMLDGAIARSSGSVTVFGGFLDSVLDRYTDLAVIGGILVYYLMQNSVHMVVLSFISAIGIALIPYARARAESLSIECKAGLLERPERIVLFLIGLFFVSSLPYVLFVLAVVTHVTVLQRILHVKRETRKRLDRSIDRQTTDR